jgi:AAA domain
VSASDERRATSDRSHSGAAFIFDLFGEEAPPIWGSSGRSLWAEGEGLMICGGQGVGKSTVAQQLVLARIGVRDPELLDLDVQPLAKGRQVLYLAMDRPRQIARSFRRMVGEKDAPKLRRRLQVHAGPLSHLDVANDPFALAQWVEDQHPRTTDVVIDSLKDLALRLSDEATGAAINAAIQELIATGRQVLVLHHQRKANGENKTPDSLADVYGSGWLTAGLGSVVYLKGQPGATSIELHHLKQPAEPVGPLTIRHDQATGTSCVADAAADVLSLVLKAGSHGVTLVEVAGEAFGSISDPAQGRARRELNKLVREGALVYLPGSSGGRGGGAKEPGRWKTA